MSRFRGDGSGGDGAGSGRLGVRAGRADSDDDGRRDGSLGSLKLLLGGKLGRGQELESALAQSVWVWTHLEDTRELLLGKLDTAADSVSDSGQDLLDLVLALNVSDYHQLYPIRRSHLLTSNLVEERGSGRVLGVVDTVRSELSSESCIGPGEVRSRSGFLVLVRSEVDQLRVSEKSGQVAPLHTSSRLASASDLRKP